MIINKIVLDNIGPYVGKNEFIFNSDSNKNIVLIGGKNGSGKTTLLKSIKYGLFGSFCLGLKNETKTYLDDIKNLLNLDDLSATHSITLQVSLVENYIKNIYDITRSWIFDDDNITENVVVTQNNKILNDYQTLEFFERLKSFSSPQLIKSFIFDGEKIGNIIENNEIKEFLEDSFTSIFNISLLKQLDLDLNTYLAKKANESANDKYLMVFNLTTSINEIKTRLKDKDVLLKKISNKINELESNKKDLIKKFFVIGGLSKGQQNRLIAESGELEKKNVEENKLLKTFIENDMCFTINSKLLKSLKTQLKKEIPYYYYDQVNSLEKYLKTNFKEIKDKILCKARISDVDVIHKIDEEKSYMIIKKIDSLLEKKNSATTLLNEKGSGSDRLTEIKNKLDNLEDVAMLDEIVMKIKQTESMIVYFHSKLLSTQKELSELNKTFNEQYQCLDTQLKEINKENIYNNSFNLTQKAIDINKKYIAYIKTSKLEKVSKLTLDIFNRTIRKNNYITNIVIDEDYNIHLYDNKNLEMNIKKLSAGEMQLIISSIIWAMFKLSGRHEMFVFDTPLARLDYENRISFLKNIVASISDQVIILSTDSEIVDENLEAIKSNIFESYRLDYIEESKSTIISKGYF